MRTANHGLVKALRRNPTDAEKKLWRMLRNRQLTGRKFRRQQSYGPYILDFYCAELKLAIELDGGQHGMPEGIKHDTHRDQYLQQEGVMILRFWNCQVIQDFETVIETIHRTLEGIPLTQTLSLEGERDSEQSNAAIIDQR
jgi:very-short-patch-repair endonuclease